MLLLLARRRENIRRLEDDVRCPAGRVIEGLWGLAASRWGEPAGDDERLAVPQKTGKGGRRLLGVDGPAESKAEASGLIPFTPRPLAHPKGRIG